MSGVATILRKRAQGHHAQKPRTQSEREYMEAWDPDAEWACEAHAMGIGPDLGHQSGPVRPDPDRVDPLDTIPDSGRELFHDDDVPPCEAGENQYSAADAILRVLHILTNSKHPSLRRRAEMLLAIINRSDVRSQAEMARRYGITKQAINKQFRAMRSGEYLAGLEIYFFGRPDVSENWQPNLCSDPRSDECKPSPVVRALAQFWNCMSKRPPHLWDETEQEEFLLDLAERERIRRDNGWTLPD